MAGNDTRPVRYFVYDEARGRVRVPIVQGEDEAAIIERAKRWGSVNLVREDGPLSKPQITVLWERSPKAAMELGDVDAVLATLVQSEDRKRALVGMEAIAVRAIVALSRAGGKVQARALMAELINERR